eukprot:CAMPEP_0197246094 /NCGR_PEP_ID=MMETSP1429-20130617/10663_1 /TAXON_ID=49237 /ORGANISM="Chaetoceros  sp., Strain UNC1202" /LENGTH=202 /DNA_ID=CAMNT_0042706697 /DNA_START=26 /DNA_END=634 /DNA_ORIENTATION=+
MISSTAHAALNVSSKRSLTQTGISGLEAQRSMSFVALSIATCVAISSCIHNSNGGESKNNSSSSGSGNGNGNDNGSNHEKSNRKQLPWRSRQSKQTPITQQKQQPSQQQQPQTSQNPSTNILPPPTLSIAAAAAYHFEYVLTFLFLKLVNPISFGTCDAIRRLGIIIAGRVMFGGEPFSMVNYAGVALALLGALGYSIGSSK